MLPVLFPFFFFIGSPVPVITDGDVYFSASNPGEIHIKTGSEFFPDGRKRYSLPGRSRIRIVQYDLLNDFSRRVDPIVNQDSIPGSNSAPADHQRVKVPDPGHDHSACPGRLELRSLRSGSHVIPLYALTLEELLDEELLDEELLELELEELLELERLLEELEDELLDLLDEEELLDDRDELLLEELEDEELELLLEELNELLEELLLLEDEELEELLELEELEELRLEELELELLDEELLLEEEHDEEELDELELDELLEDELEELEL